MGDTGADTNLQVDERTQQAHLRTLSAHFDYETNAFVKKNERVVLQSVDPHGHVEHTYMDFSGDHQGLLVSQLESFPDGLGDISRVKVFTARDQQLCFNVFTFSKKVEPQASAPATSSRRSRMMAKSPEAGPQAILEMAADLKAQHEAGHDTDIEWSPLFEPEALQEFMARCPEEFVEHSRPRSFLRQRMLFEQVTGTENVAIHAEESLPGDYLAGLADEEVFLPDPVEGRSNFWLRLAFSNSVPQVLVFPRLRRARSLRSRRAWPGSLCFAL